MADSNKILKLDEDVINRIAAGEVILRPSNAVKELLENCLDAGSTNCVITANKGGLKSLRIDDNGHGIRKEDLPILCERFTTSKIRSLDDLRSVTTFGFRGEALCSVSQVSHLTIVTRTKDAPMASSATYLQGKLQDKPKLVAGRPFGTTITFEDLFHNLSVRRNVVKNASEEYNHIQEVVSRYALHNPHVAFTCKKYQSTVADVRTPGSLTHREVVGILYGSELESKLIDFEFTNPNPSLQLEAKGLISDCNWISKQMVFVLFINNRLVESSRIKRMIDSIYSMHLQNGRHPWVYLSLKLHPKGLDVNVHPTKKEVMILEEAAVIKLLENRLVTILQENNKSRQFDALRPEKRSRESRQSLSSGAPAPARIRVDTNQISVSDSSKSGTLGMGQSDWKCHCAAAELWEDVKRKCHEISTHQITHSVWVGCVDDQLSLVQCGSHLFLVNMLTIGGDFAYQCLLRSCGKQATFCIEPGVSTWELFVDGHRDPASGFEGTDEELEAMFPQFEEWVEKEGKRLTPFGFTFKDKQLLSIPKILPFCHITPGIPLLILRLWKSYEQRTIIRPQGQGIEREDEEEMKESAQNDQENEQKENKDTVEQYLRIAASVVVEDILDLPEAKMSPRTDLADPESKLHVHKLWEHIHLSFFQASSDYVSDGTMVKLCGLEQLYKVFERC